jgi:hypothetical protein
MFFTNANTRYAAQKEFPQCYAFYKTSHGYVCFYCAQALATWKNQ